MAAFFWADFEGERVMIKTWLSVAVVAVAAALVGGCATGGGAGYETLDAAGLAKVFKSGSKYCKWTAGDTKGEDFYYTTATSKGGDADRNMKAASL